MNQKCGVTPENIRSLKVNEVFVFGSNLSGIHGAGAARLAMDEFGALYGKGEGLTGQCYALPTKDKHIITLSLEKIKKHVISLRVCVENNKDKFFLVTKVGCGLAGYFEEEIAPLFVEFLDIANCSLPLEFINIIKESHD